MVFHITKFWFTETVLVTRNYQNKSYPWMHIILEKLGNFRIAERVCLGISALLRVCITNRVRVK